MLCALCIFLSGCATPFAYRVDAPLAPAADVRLIENVPPVAQKAYQCGPAALESVLRYWGRDVDADSIARAIHKPGSRGVFNFMLSERARALGFWTQFGEDADQARLGSLKSWIEKKIPPVVMLYTGVLWVPNYHFVVLKGFHEGDRIFYANTGEPDTYAIRYAELEKRWKAAGYWRLIICPPERVDWELDAVQAADLALLCERSGRLDLAEKWYRRALDKDPANAAAQFNLANVYLKSKRYGEAEAIYTGLLKKDSPAMARASNNLAWIYVEQGRAREAVDVIETAFQNGAERRFDILDTLGLAYGRLGRQELARQCFLEAKNKVPPGDTQALEAIEDHARALGE